MNCKRILLALDGSDNSMRAVDYVGALTGPSADGFHVQLLHVERLPDRDIFPDEAAWRQGCEEYQLQMRSFLERARRTLHAAGFSEDSLSEEYVVSCRSPFRERAVAHCSAGESVSQEILRAMQEGGFGTIAIGRRGVSKQEEFLFGSVSNRIIHYAKGCTVWVVN